MSKYSRRIKSNKGKKTTLPIKEEKLLKRVMDYLWGVYISAKSDSAKYRAYRNYMLLLIGFNTAFRAEDLLQLRVLDVEKGYITIKENKTGKTQNYRMNKELHEEILQYINRFQLNNYLFMGQKKIETRDGVSRDVIYPITRQNCDDVIFPKICKACGIDFNFSLHSLRKTFGYMYILHGGNMLTLQHMYNHSSTEETLLYVMWDLYDVEKTRSEIYIGGKKKSAKD